MFLLAAALFLFRLYDLPPTWRARQTQSRSYAFFAYDGRATDEEWGEHAKLGGPIHGHEWNVCNIFPNKDNIFHCRTKLTVFIVLYNLSYLVTGMKGFN